MSGIPLELESYPSNGKPWKRFWDIRKKKRLTFERPKATSPTTKKLLMKNEFVSNTQLNSQSDNSSQTS
jgi:hypothetical protein